MEPKAFVKNAADPKQVKKAKSKEDRKRFEELRDLRAVLETEEGRRVLWRFLEECKVFGSVWHPSAQIHYNAGRQDFGHYIMSEIVDAGEEYLFTLMKENKKGDVNA